MTANRTLRETKRESALRNEKGAELVETSLVIGLFFCLMVGVFEFGRAYNIYQNITNAAREGARFAVAPQKGGGLSYPTSDEVRAVIVNFLQSASISDPGSTNLQILLKQDVGGVGPCDPSVSGSPCGTRVNLTCPFQILGIGSINIKTSVVMRNET